MIKATTLLLACLMLLINGNTVKANEHWEVSSSIEIKEKIFTQGMEVNNGKLWLSSGLYEKSFLAQYSLENSRIEKHHLINKDYFAEGLAISNNTLTLLTWKAGKALRFSLPDLTPLQPFTYYGEGWGLCFDGRNYWMSNGTDTLQKRSKNFELIDSIRVDLPGYQVNHLNELECFNGWIAANHWKNNSVYLINPQTGKVHWRLDFSSLANKHKKAGVLNGIAWDHSSKKLLITGKNWQRIYLIEILVDLSTAKNNNQQTAVNNE